jgi:hypothetical protein
VHGTVRCTVSNFSSMNAEKKSDFEKKMSKFFFYYGAKKCTPQKTNFFTHAGRKVLKS